MSAFSHSQIDSLNKAILRLYEPVAFHHFHERAFEVAAMIVRHDVAGFSAMNTETKAADAFLSVAALGPLLKSFEHADDFYSMPGVADGSYFSTAAPTSMLDFTTVDAFKGRAIYETLYKELDILYDASINFHAHSDHTFCQLNVTRKSKFSAEERRLLHFLQPHLSQRYRQLLADKQNHPLTGPMALRERNWLICDTTGAIRARSPRVGELLGSFGWPCASFLPAEWMTWFRSQLQPADAATLPHPLVIKRKGRHLTLHCLPNRLSGEHRLVFETATFSPGVLSSREREIARWMAAGKTNAEIGEILHISRFTVKNHVQNILAKLEIENRTTAALLLAAGTEGSGPLA